MAERAHQWRVWMVGSDSIGVIEPIGAAYDAPDDYTKSPSLVKDVSGVVHSVVKVDGRWCYCDIEVMKDWLTQDGKNVVLDDTTITCVKCLVGDHEG